MNSFHIEFGVEPYKLVMLLWSLGLLNDYVARVDGKRLQFIKVQT